jgi:hypothetical protein
MAIARPIPEPAPVINTFTPSNDMPPPFFAGMAVLSPPLAEKGTNTPEDIPEIIRYSPALYHKELAP